MTEFEIRYNLRYKKHSYPSDIRDFLPQYQFVTLEQTKLTWIDSDEYYWEEVLLRINR